MKNLGTLSSLFASLLPCPRRTLQGNKTIAAAASICSTSCMDGARGIERIGIESPARPCPSPVPAGSLSTVPPPRGGRASATLPWTQPLMKQQPWTMNSPPRCDGRNACAWTSSSRTRPCPSSTSARANARVAIASWPSTCKAKSAPRPLLCFKTTRSAIVGHVTTAPRPRTAIPRSPLSHNRRETL